MPSKTYLTSESDFGPERDEPLARRRRHGQRAAARRPDASIGTSTGRGDRRHLRHRDEVQPGQRRHQRRSRPRSARLPQRGSVADDGARPGELHDPEDGRARQRDGAFAAGGAAAGATANTSAQWVVPNSVDPGGARPPAGRRDGHRHDDDSARRQRSTASTRTTGGPSSTCASPRSLRFGRTRVGHRRRPQQPAEHQLRDRLQHDLHLQRRQHAAGRHAGATRPASMRRGSCASTTRSISNSPSNVSTRRPGILLNAGPLRFPSDIS